MHFTIMNVHMHKNGVNMSPRYKKPRFCQCCFRGKAFKPTGIPMIAIEKITLSRDELETLKLCDVDDLTQEQAGKRMGV